jgi:branched-chain amino acid transport system permease protein
MLKKIPRYSIIQDKTSEFFSKHIKYFYGVLFLLVFFIPLYPFSSNYIVYVCTYAMLYVMLALGLNIVPGFTGLLDLGYVGFFGIGAYTVGVITLKLMSLGSPWDVFTVYWLLIPIAALNGALWGILLGVPTLRLTGDYFAIVTFGFSELVVLVILNEMWLTRGPMGIPGIPRPFIDLTFLYPITKYFHADPISYTFKPGMSYFYLVLIMVVVTIFIMNRLENSRLGRAWFAIREDEVAAECCGINIMKYKVIAFAISASFGGIAGSFFAVFFGFISPVSFKFWESILILCMVVLGGMGSIPGVIIGATILTTLSEVLRKVIEVTTSNVHQGKIAPWLLKIPFSEEIINAVPWDDLAQARYAIFGIILILMMRFKPAGIIPLGRVKRQMRKKDETLEYAEKSFYGVASESKKLDNDR